MLLKDFEWIFGKEFLASKLFDFSHHFSLGQSRKGLEEGIPVKFTDEELMKVERAGSPLHLSNNLSQVTLVVEVRGRGAPAYTAFAELV